MQRRTGKGGVMALGERDVIAITFARSEDDVPGDQRNHASGPSRLHGARGDPCQERYMAASCL